MTKIMTPSMTPSMTALTMGNLKCTQILLTQSLKILSMISIIKSLRMSLLMITLKMFKTRTPTTILSLKLKMNTMRSPLSKTNRTRLNNQNLTKLSNQQSLTQMVSQDRTISSIMTTNRKLQLP